MAVNSLATVRHGYPDRFFAARGFALEISAALGLLIYGSGGLLNIVRSRSSVRFKAVSRGNRSSASRSVVAGGFGALFIAEVSYG